MSLFLVFTKQYRTEEKIISELVKKIKKSEMFSTGIDGDNEVYELDGLNISFSLTTPQKLTVTDKKGKKIYSMDAGYVQDDEMQKVRFGWFSNLLTIARERHAKEQAKKDKSKQMKEAKNALSKAEEVKAKRERNLAIAIEALKRMKGL